MTAIIVGRLKRATFAVSDAMVQPSLQVKSYKECRLDDKITDFDKSDQFLLLAGEELVALGAGMLNQWSNRANKKYDLFNSTHFKYVLELALRRRKISVDLYKHKIIEQDRTDVYIVGRHQVKNYSVNYSSNKFIISAERLLDEGEIILNYKGNSKTIPAPFDSTDLISFGKKQLNSEHNWRKSYGAGQGKFALNYDFENRFSSVLIWADETRQIERLDPFLAPTEYFLAADPQWDYVKDPTFEYCPPE